MYKAKQLTSETLRSVVEQIQKRLFLTTVGNTLYMDPFKWVAEDTVALTEELIAILKTYKLAPKRITKYKH